MITSGVLLEADKELTALEVAVGEPINVQNVKTVGVWIEPTANDSENVELVAYANRISGGVDYVINGCSNITLWTTTASAGYYEFDVGALKYLNLKIKAGTVGATAGVVTVYYTQVPLYKK